MNPDFPLAPQEEACLISGNLRGSLSSCHNSKETLMFLPQLEGNPELSASIRDVAQLPCDSRGTLCSQSQLDTSPTIMMQLQKIPKSSLLLLLLLSHFSHVRLCATP